MAVALTVVVKGEDGKFLSGATVMANPGNFTATTDSSGEATLKVEGANRYQITVSSTGSKKQIVPFYVVDKQTTAKLEVNLQYFKQLSQINTQAKKDTIPATSRHQTDTAYAGYFIVTGVVLLILFFVIITHRKKHHKVRQ